MRDTIQVLIRGDLDQRLEKSTQYSLELFEENYGLASCQFDVYTRKVKNTALYGCEPFAEHHFITFQLRKSSHYAIGYTSLGLYLKESKEVDGTHVRTIAESFNVSDFLEIVRRLDETKTYNIVSYNCQNFVEEVEQNICNHIAEETHC